MFSNHWFWLMFWNCVFALLCAFKEHINLRKWAFDRKLFCFRNQEKPSLTYRCFLKTARINLFDKFYRIFLLFIQPSHWSTYGSEFLHNCVCLSAHCSYFSTPSINILYVPTKKEKERKKKNRWNHRSLSHGAQYISKHMVCVCAEIGWCVIEHFLTKQSH